MREFIVAGRIDGVRDYKTDVVEIFEKARAGIAIQLLLTTTKDLKVTSRDPRRCRSSRDVAFVLRKDARDVTALEVGDHLRTCIGEWKLLLENPINGIRTAASSDRLGGGGGGRCGVGVGCGC